MRRNTDTGCKPQHGGRAPEGACHRRTAVFGINPTRQTGFLDTSFDFIDHLADVSHGNDFEGLVVGDQIVDQCGGQLGDMYLKKTGITVMRERARSHGAVVQGLLKRGEGVIKFSLIRLSRKAMTSEISASLMVKLKIGSSLRGATDRHCHRCSRALGKSLH